MMSEGIYLPALSSFICLCRYVDGTPARATVNGLKNLRTARILERNMVLTVEPGCYFIEFIINNAENDAALKEFINFDLIRSDYTNFGGVRLEDVVMVTGTINLL